MKIVIPDGYMPIRTSTLVTHWVMAMDVFLPVNGKPVRYAANGEELDADRYKRLRDHRVMKVLIRKDDEEKYRSFLEEIMNEAESNEKIPQKERSTAMSGNAENAAQNITEKPEDSGTFKNSQQSFDRLARFLTKSPSAYIDILKNPSKQEADQVSHGVQVATLAFAVAEAMNLFKVPEWKKFLVTGASIHDFGMEKLGLTLKAHEQMSPDEKAKWLEHTNVAYQTFNTKEFVDPIIIQIISQHEEIPNGSGFPNKLHGKQMNPLSIAVSVANTFDHYSMKHDGDRQAALTEFMTQEMGRYDLEWLTTVQKLVKAVAV